MPSRHRSTRSLAARIALVAFAGAPSLGCTEHERPDPIADPRGAADRAVSGSFRAPGAGANAGSSGAASTGLDAGSVDAGPGATGAGPVALEQTYEGRCEDGTVQWGFFIFEAATPGDSSIVFRLRTAALDDQLANGTFIELLTASSALGTERCGFAGPAPCPVDLFDALAGAPLAHHRFAQLRVLLRAASDGRMPAVEAWQLTYSCTLNQ